MTRRVQGWSRLTSRPVTRSLALASCLALAWVLPGPTSVARAQDAETPSEPPASERAAVPADEPPGEAASDSPTDPPTDSATTEEDPPSEEPTSAPDASETSASSDEATDGGSFEGQLAAEAEEAPAAADSEATEPRAPGEEALDPCATINRSRPIGPLQLGQLDGMLGVGHRACPRQELSIGGDFLLVADTANLYGNLRANGRIQVSAPLFDPRVELFVSWEAVRYQSLLSAVSASYLGLGYLSWGASGQVLNENGRVLALTARFVAPTTTGLDQHSQPLALDLGVSGAWQVHANVRFHMWVLALGSIGVGAGPAEPRVGLRLGGGVDWHPLDALGIVLEVQSGFGYASALDLVAAALGVRLAFGDEVGLELSASLPLVGERALDDGALPIAANLMLNWRAL